MEHLLKMYNEAVQLLNDIGIRDISVSEIKLNAKLKKTLGQYSEKTKEIEISKLHYYCSTKEEVFGTILHEISHNVCQNRFGPQGENGGHTEKWQEIADYITENTGYKMQPVSNVSWNMAKVNRIPEYYHRFKCKKCGYEYTTYSKKENPAEVKKRKCIGCQCAYLRLGRPYSDGEFEVIKSGISRYRITTERN